MPTKMEVAKKILDHPIMDAMTGISLGGLLGNRMYKDKRDRLTELMAKEEGQVNAEDIVAEYSPDLDVVSTRDDVKKIKDINFIERFALKHMIPEDDKPWDNAFYLPIKGNEAVVVPKKVSPHVVGHEIGHHRDFEGDVPGFFETGRIGTLRGKVLDMERRAWEKSPIELDETGEEMKGLALGAYENKQKYTRIGLGFGLGIIAARRFGPKVLEMIRGNIR